MSGRFISKHGPNESIHVVVDEEDIIQRTAGTGYIIDDMYAWPAF